MQGRVDIVVASESVRSIVASRFGDLKKVSGGPWTQPDALTSISPDFGHSPYTLSLGSIQIAGQSQSPVGILAVTSTLPYLMLTDFFVCRRALRTGLMICSRDELDTAAHWVTLVEVHVPSTVKLSV